jgi:hypothetical protein
MSKAEVKINRDKNLFIIKRDTNFNHLLDISLVFYRRLMTLIQDADGVILQMNPKFLDLIGKVTVDAEKIYLSEEDVALFVDWVDCLCLIMLDLDSVDYKSKEVKKYLTLSERFIKRSKELMCP